MNPNIKPGESDADFCRRMGWTIGTRIAGDEGYGDTVIEITAIGDHRILAKAIYRCDTAVADGELQWTLSYRHWKAVI